MGLMEAEGTMEVRASVEMAEVRLARADERMGARVTDGAVEAVTVTLSTDVTVCVMVRVYTAGKVEAVPDAETTGLAVCVMVAVKVDEDSGALPVATGETSVPLTGCTMVVT